MCFFHCKYKLTSPEITVCYISKVTKKDSPTPSFHHTGWSHLSSSEHTWAIASFTSWKRLRGKEELDIFGGRCENSMRRPKNRLVTEIMLYIVRLIWYLYHQNIWSFKYAYLWAKHTFHDVEGKHVRNCMLSGRNVPKMMMAYQKYHRWCGPFAKGLLAHHCHPMCLRRRLSQASWLPSQLTPG